MTLQEIHDCGDPPAQQRARLAAEKAARKIESEWCGGCNDRDATVKAMASIILDSLAAVAGPQRPRSMTNEALQIAIRFHQSEAARFRNELAKAWRFRIQMGIATDKDNERAAALSAWQGWCIRCLLMRLGGFGRVHQCL